MALFTLPISIHLNSYTFAIFMISTLILKIKEKAVIQIHPFMMVCVVFFILTALEYFNSYDKISAKNFIEKRLGYLFIPILFYQVNANILKNVLLFWVKAIMLLLIFLLLYAFIRYIKGSDGSVFYYHELCYPIYNHAIFISLIVSIAMLITWFYYSPSKKYIKILLLLLFYFFLMLLSSKNIFTVTSIIFFVLVSKKIISMKLWLSGAVFIVLGTAFLLSLENSNIISRIKQASQYDFHLAYATKVTEATRFDGTNLRLRLWNYGWHILSENNAFVWGVSPADTQRLLDAKIIKSDMYIGSDKKSDKGFLGYDFHNQYVQTFVETGIIGLVLLLSMFLILLYEGYVNKTPFLIFLNILFAVAFISESNLGRQAGIFSFLAFNTIGLLLIKIKNTDEYNQTTI